MNAFSEIVDAVYEKIRNGKGIYYVYTGAFSSIACTHLKPMKERDVMLYYDLQLVGVYDQGIARQQLLEDICFLWNVKRAKAEDPRSGFTGKYVDRKSPLLKKPRHR